MSVPELLTCQDVMKITGIRSRTTIWRRVQAGEFPADSDDAGRLFRSDPGHHSDMMPAGLSLIAGM